MAAKADADAQVAEAAAGGHTYETSDKARTVDNDILGAEALRRGVVGDSSAWSANIKRTYDRLEEELSSSVKSAQDHLNNVRTVQLQMLTNMTVNSDALQKQHTAHRDLATDRTWNIDEQGNMAAIIAEAIARQFQTGEK